MQNQKVGFLKRREKPKKRKTSASQKKFFAKVIFEFGEGHSAEQPTLAAAPNNQMRKATQTLTLNLPHDTLHDAASASYHRKRKAKKNVPLASRMRNTNWLHLGFASASLWLRCGFAVASLWLRCGFAVAPPRLRCFTFGLAARLASRPPARPT